MIYIEYITYVIYLEYDLVFSRFPAGIPRPLESEALRGHMCPLGKRILPRVYIFAKNKGLRRRNGINIYIPTIVTSTLGDVDDTGITTAAILPVGASV